MVDDKAKQTENDGNSANITTDVRFDKPVPGSTLRCLEDPIFDPEINSPAAKPVLTTDSLDKAHDRFDRFWGGKPESTLNENANA